MHVVTLQATAVHCCYCNLTLHSCALQSYTALLCTNHTLHSCAAIVVAFCPDFLHLLEGYITRFKVKEELVIQAFDSYMYSYSNALTTKCALGGCSIAWQLNSYFNKNTFIFHQNTFMLYQNTFMVFQNTLIIYKKKWFTKI